MLRTVLAFLVFIMPTLGILGQNFDSTKVDLIDLIIGKKEFAKINEERSNKKVHFSILPAPVNAPGSGRAVITSISAAFVLGESETTNVSNIYFVPFTDFSNRFGLYIRPNIWLENNTWNFIGDYRIERYPQYTWGLGGGTSDSARTQVDRDYLRIHQSALKNIDGSWFAGIGYALDHNYNIEESEFEGEGNLDQYPINSTSTTSSGLTINLTYDARYNAINPPKGGYFTAALRLNAKALGSSTNYQSLFVDGRKYFPLHNKRTHILALRSYYWTIINGDVPYLDLPATNSTPTTGISSRGFRAGRYRSNAMLYAEAEERLQLTSNGLFGLVAFVNTSAASEFDTQNFQHWKIGAGLGVRTKFNKYSDTNVAIDFGFSRDFWSVWLNIGEMF